MSVLVNSRKPQPLYCCELCPQSVTDPRRHLEESHQYVIAEFGTEESTMRRLVVRLFTFAKWS